MGQWQSQPVCTTPACIHAASRILQNLAPNWTQMDPCTEFDKMVCYGFTEHNGDNANAFTSVNLHNQMILRQVLESATEAQAAGVRSTFLTSRSNAEEDNFDMLRTGWKACMDTEAIAAAGIKPLSDFIVTINQSWPVPPDDLDTKVSASDYDGMFKAALLLEEVGITAWHAFCAAETGPALPDPLNSKANRVCFKMPGAVQQNTSVFIDQDAFDSYGEVVAGAFQLIYADLDDEDAEALAEAVIEFERDLLELVVPITDAANGDVYNIIKNASLADIGKAAPAFSLDKLVAAMMPEGHTPTEILLQVPDAWPDLSALVSNHSRAAVHGFMMWKTITELADYVDVPDLSELLGKPTTPRWQTCVSVAETQLRDVLDHYYVTATYPDLALQAADKMTTNIRNQFKKRLGEIDWMSDDSKKRAIQKAENMHQNIGYPTSNPDIRSADALASEYAGLNLTSTSHFANMLAARRHNTQRQYAAIVTPPDRGSFDGSITVVNAFYNPSINSMIVPAGISQLPLFHPQLPDYALYGGLGAAIGHEITHGFDSRGRLFDENAERRQWWDNATIAGFQQRAECFVKQYSAVEVDVPGGKAHVDGNLTLAENLADAGGLHTAYDAWVADRKAMPAAWDQDLPGLSDFTHEQLFYLVWGNFWCDSMTPDRMPRQLEDVHAPSLVRLLLNTMNSRGFREAWKCKVQEPVCELW